ncbi:MAG: GGDEF domain-containing protein, partial [Thiohalospira sp.]
TIHRLRRGIAGLAPVVEEDTIPFTVSGGLVTLNDQRGDPESLIRAADRALYIAKEGGRDRIIVADSGHRIGGDGELAEPH